MVKIVNPKQIYTYHQMVEDIIQLEKAYPNLIHREVIGKTVDGRDLHAVKLGVGDVEIFMNGAHHAREWLTTSLLMEMINEYAEAFTSNELIGDYNVCEILTKSSIWFVPMVNPDGVTLVQKGHRTANNYNAVLALNGNKQDFSAWKANIRGVDLNRQYPAGWETIENDPGKPAPSMYKGPKPLSEPETKAIYQFTLSHNFKTAVAYHSSGEEIFWKYKSRGEFLDKTKKIADKLSAITGYSLVFPSPNPSGGGYTDWFLDEIKRPGFTIEIAPLVGPRPVPLANYDKIWKENKEVGLMLAMEATQRG